MANNSLTISDLIPQRPPFLFIERIEELNPAGDEAVTSALWNGDSLAVGADGQIKETIIIEALAQTAALLVGAKNRATSDKPPAIGYLAAISAFNFSAPIPRNERLFFKVQTVREFGAFFVSAATCYSGEKTLAGGELTFYLDKDA